MAKELSFKEESLEHLKIGVNIIADAVKATLGPQGRLVMYGDGKHAQTRLTKDGATVAKQMFVDNPYQDRAVQLVKEAAEKTAADAGDGTTSCTVLIQSIVLQGIKNITAGASPVDLKRGIEKAVNTVIENIKKQSIAIDGDYQKVRNVATISANNDEELGNLIGGAMEKIGKDGIVTVDASKDETTYVDIVQGMQIDAGYISPLFVNDTKKMQGVYENPYILLYDKSINSMNDIIHILQKYTVEKSTRPFIIIAEDVEGEALSSLVVNKVQGNFPVMCIKAPGYGYTKNETLKDIAALTGGTVISETEGASLEQATISMLGRAKKVIVTKETTTIIDGEGDYGELQERIISLKTQLEEATDKEVLSLRIARLNGGVAILYIGASSTAEFGEKADRIEDALHATRASVKEGIVPGGGVTYIRCIDALKKLKGSNADENTGIDIISNAIQEPLKQICANAGISGEIVIAEVSRGKNDFGYNAKTNTYEHLIKAGVIDPTKVARVALQNAASVAIQILLTDVIIVNKEG